MGANDRRHNLFAALIDVVLFKIGGVDYSSAIANITSNLANKADLVGGFVDTNQLPSYVDDVLEYANFAALPGTGTTGKIYVTLDDNITYRWSGSVYVEISASLALGETSGTAYRGDRGKTAYDHSQLVTGNPHAVTKTEVGLSNVDNTSNSTERAAARTLTNARVVPRVSTEASNVAPNPDFDANDCHNITALAGDISTAITWTGTLLTEENRVINITPTGGVRQLSFNSSKFEESDSQLFPTETFAAGVKMTLAFKYNAATSKLRLLAVS